MNKDKLILELKSYFQKHADIYDIETAFLYGSYAGGYPKEESDIDVAVLFSQEMSEEKAFAEVSSLSLELTDILKQETNLLYIDTDLSKPMLHYNAIVYGIPIFVRDFTRYADIKMKAISQMEDFSIFGIKWQSEIVRKRLE
ncbi:MAG: nucleotidyltransferase domain-containing protein, partial [Nitrospinae bacterium]|nr:nucleotidyltransferase domain-containing protein [Nitrospinota bacterium]